MRIVSLTVIIAHRSGGEAFASIADFASYPKHSAAVRSVVVTRSRTVDTALDVGGRLP